MWIYCKFCGIIVIINRNGCSYKGIIREKSIQGRIGGCVLESKLNLEKYIEYKDCKSQLSEEFKKILVSLSKDEIISIVRAIFEYTKVK
ncbi:hypothetical protein [Clostridium sp.]|uniref:hypothetical protein n=1 Tax=Clostridium sp. TaxID=1506 RepID=UPI0035A11DD4